MRSPARRGDVDEHVKARAKGSWNRDTDLDLGGFCDGSVVGPGFRQRLIVVSRPERFAEHTARAESRRRLVTALWLCWVSGFPAYCSEGAMTDSVDVYQGRARRRCPRCRVEIEIEKPTRVLSKTLDPRLEKEGAPGDGAADLLGDALSGLQELVERHNPRNRKRRPEADSDRGAH